MTEERFGELCREAGVTDQRRIDHIWKCHKPPDTVTEDEVRTHVPLIIKAHELGDSILAAAIDTDHCAAA